MQGIGLPIVEVGCLLIFGLLFFQVIRTVKNKKETDEPITKGDRAKLAFTLFLFMAALGANLKYFLSVDEGKMVVFGTIAFFFGLYKISNL